MRRQPCAGLPACFALLFVLAAAAPGREWPRFRGPNGTGVADTRVPIRWGEQDFDWRVRLAGAGHSSPAVWGERVFVTSADEKTGRRVIQCLRLDDGRELWRREFPGERHRKHADNSFASATPAVDDRHVYVAWGGPKDYLVVALGHDGKEAWRTDLGRYRGGHGFGASPIAHDGLVVVANDQDGPSSLVALDRDSGQARWKVPRKGKSTFTTPCVYQPAGRPAELIFTNWDHGITSVDPKTGQVNWEADVFDKRHVETGIGSPIAAGALILGTCGWLGVRQEIVAVRPGGRGEKAEQVYRITRSAPLCTTPLVKDDLLFVWSDGGFVTCADVRTGEAHWRQRVPGDYYSSPVCAGGHLYNVSRDGEVVVLAASKRFELVARNPAGEGSHSTPAVAGGRLLVRTFNHLLSVGGGRAPGRAAPPAVRPFKINVDDAVLKDLRERLARTRFPDAVEGAAWDHGPGLDYMKKLVDYWRKDYDWRAEERKLNRLEQFVTEIDGVDVHFIHQRSKVKGALPLAIVHGWPGSVAEFQKIVGPLTDPEAHGGKAEDAFHVVCPSLPGFGFSGRPKQRGWTVDRMAAAVAELMKRLGYERYGAQGGDWGAGVARWLGSEDAKHVVGIHLNFVPAQQPPPGARLKREVTQKELERVRKRNQELQDHRGYGAIQGTRPQALGFALNDSPAGLAAWVVDKFWAWSDHRGDLENSFTRDELLTNVMLYWVTESMPSAMRIYYESSHNQRPRGRVRVPVGAALFPKEIAVPPRAWVEQQLDVVHWTEMPRGGHFAALEVPDLLVNDVRAFFRPLRAKK